ncbi:unnamed protein product, partial [Musa textilis]
THSACVVLRLSARRGTRARVRLDPCVLNYRNLLSRSRNRKCDPNPESSVRGPRG